MQVVDVHSFVLLCHLSPPGRQEPDDLCAADCQGVLPGLHQVQTPRCHQSSASGVLEDQESREETSPQERTLSKQGSSCKEDRR